LSAFNCERRTKKEGRTCKRENGFFDDTGGQIAQKKPKERGGDFPRVNLPDRKKKGGGKKKKREGGGRGPVFRSPAHVSGRKKKGGGETSSGKKKKGKKMLGISKHECFFSLPFSNGPGGREKKKEKNAGREGERPF